MRARRIIGSIPLAIISAIVGFGAPTATAQHESMPDAQSVGKSAHTRAGQVASEPVDIRQPPDNWPNNYPYNYPPIKREWPDGPNKSFLENLQRPDNHKHPHRNKDSQSCCDAGDTVQTKFRVEPYGEDGHHPQDLWYAWINGEWVLVPPDKIVPDYAPDGQAYLFVLAGTIQCFVRPKGGF